MKIKIITTEKKLTKSIINQMPVSCDITMKFGKSLGYILNVRKNMYKVALIHYDGNYSIISMDYKKGIKSVNRKVGKGIIYKNFESEILCDIWWENFQKILNNNLQHIYI